MATLYADFGLKEYYGDIPYSRNRALGRVVRDYLVMKYAYAVQVPVTVERAVTDSDNITKVVHETRTVIEMRVGFSKYDKGAAVSPRAYMLIKDADMDDIYKFFDSPAALFPTASPAPAPPPPIEGAPKPAT